MARKPKSTDGAANKTISFAVTKNFYEKITALAEITSGGNVSAFVKDLLANVVEVNAGIIAENLRAKKSYNTVNSQLKEKWKNPFEQSDSSTPAAVEDESTPVA